MYDGLGIEAVDAFYKKAIADEFERIYCILRREGAENLDELREQSIHMIEGIRVARVLMFNLLGDSKFPEERISQKD